jgi:DinB superfamily
MMDAESLQYPLGKYIPKPFSPELRDEWIVDVQYLPDHLERAVLNLDEAQLKTAYREGGWTVQQVVHHVADSHMNAFIRFKLALTEANPVIKPYNQDAWVLHVDVEQVPVNVSITLLFALHRRWVNLLQHLSDKDWDLKVIHPEYGKEMSLWYLLGLYAWHGRHHTAHITRLRKRMSW